MYFIIAFTLGCGLSIHHSKPFHMATGAQLDISYLVRSSVNKRPLNIGLYLDRNVVTMQETEIHCSSPQGTFEKLTVYLHILKPRCSLHLLFNSQFGKATHTLQHRTY